MVAVTLNVLTTLYGDSTVALGRGYTGVGVAVGEAREWVGAAETIKQPSFTLTSMEQNF